VRNIVYYNSNSHNGKGREEAETIRALLPQAECVSFVSIPDDLDFKAEMEGFGDDGKAIITGGDGTLNHFIQRIGDGHIGREIYYFPTGSGNDFMRDVADGEKRIIKLNPYIENLPIVTVNGVSHRFINGVGYGIDGYCCEEADRLRASGKKRIPSYALIALKGLLFSFRTVCAKVTVDGKTSEYENVWLCPTMNGRFYGGGIMITPAQDRLGKDRLLSVCVMHDLPRLKALLLFTTIFSGGHVKHRKHIAILTGHDITVEFDRPTALQIDGETISGVTMCHSVKK